MEETRVPKASSARFEDLEVWQASRLLVKDIYQATSVGGYARDFGLRDQTRRSAVSVMSNIAGVLREMGTKSCSSSSHWRKARAAKSGASSMLLQTKAIFPRKNLNVSASRLLG